VAASRVAPAAVVVVVEVAEAAGAEVAVCLAGPCSAQTKSDWEPWGFVEPLALQPSDYSSLARLRLGHWGQEGCETLQQRKDEQARYWYLPVNFARCLIETVGGLVGALAGDMAP